MIVEFVISVKVILKIDGVDVWEWCFGMLNLSNEWFFVEVKGYVSVRFILSDECLDVGFEFFWVSCIEVDDVGFRGKCSNNFGSSCFDDVYFVGGLVRRFGNVILLFYVICVGNFFGKVFIVGECFGELFVEVEFEFVVVDIDEFGVRWVLGGRYGVGLSSLWKFLVKESGDGFVIVGLLLECGFCYESLGWEEKRELDLEVEILCYLDWVIEV